ncbi:MAG: DUF5667 domain-containing protein [Patescibacteria group bacterium]
MKHIVALYLFGILLLATPLLVRAEYVLPYPSYMPGNKHYKISRFIDKIRQPFYFGNLSSYKYHLSLADKYLVEAKTLFEYKQYLLASDALARSDSEFAKTTQFLLGARQERKDISAFVRQLAQASALHTEILLRMNEVLPPSYEWKPEKSDAIQLSIADMVRESVMVRKNAVIRLR